MITKRGFWRRASGTVGHQAAVSRNVSTSPQTEGIAIRPDGREVWAASNTGHVNIVDIATGTITTKLEPFGQPYRLAMSPDGKTGWFTSGSNEAGDIYYNDKIFLVPAAGGAARILLPDVPYEASNAQWSKDGKTIFFLANLGVHDEILKVDVASRQVTPITKGDHALGSVASDVI